MGIIVGSPLHLHRFYPILPYSCIFLPPITPILLHCFNPHYPLTLFIDLPHLPQVHPTLASFYQPLSLTLALFYTPITPLLLNRCTSPLRLRCPLSKFSFVSSSSSGDRENQLRKKLRVIQCIFKVDEFLSQWLRHLFCAKFLLQLFGSDSAF